MTKKKAQGFSFRKHEVAVEIEGKAYKIEQGDSDMADRLLSVQKLAEGISYEQLAADGKLYRTLSGKVREVIRALLGDETFEEVLGGRPANVISELELLAYLYGEVQSQADSARLDDLLETFEAQPR